MSKTKRSFVRDDYEDEGSYAELHQEKMARKNERLLERALKTKNIEAFIPDDEVDPTDEFMDYLHEETEDYVSCIDCGKVLITEEDQKGAMYFYNDETDETTTTCASCLKHSEDN